MSNAFDYIRPSLETMVNDGDPVRDMLGLVAAWLEDRARMLEGNASFAFDEEGIDPEPQRYAARQLRFMAQRARGDSQKQDQPERESEGG